MISNFSTGDRMRAIALIDGEHYLPVNKAALEHLRTVKHYDVVATVFIGGTEKIGTMDDLNDLGVPVVYAEKPLNAIQNAIELYHPDTMVDLSDEPVAGYHERFEMANLILAADVIYEGADFCFTPPEFVNNCQKPALSIVGTGKRIGKTAFGAYTGRLISGQEGFETDFHPCIVTMGRGGPAVPEVLHGETLQMTPEFFYHAAKQGKHAASDHYEDALLSRLTTIGCRRCGGGFAGVVYTSTVPQGTEIANQLDHNFVIFEGSGASIPPIRVDAWLLCVGAHQPLEYVSGYMGPYRVRKADAIVLTLCEEPVATPEMIANMTTYIRRLNPQATLLQTIFRPRPLQPIENKRVLYATTAPEKMGAILSDYLEETYNCQVVGRSHSLSNRPKLRMEMDRLLAQETIDTLLVEVKAAAIDVVTRIGIERGLTVVYADNIPQPLHQSTTEFAQSILSLAHTARNRFNQRQENLNEI